MSLHNPISPLRALYVQKVLPAVYDDSLSYYEVLAKTQEKLNEVISDTNDVSALVLELQQAMYDFIHGGYTDTFEEYLDEWFAENSDEFVQRLIDEGVIPEVEDLQSDIDSMHGDIADLVASDASIRSDMSAAITELQSEDTSIRNDMSIGDLALTNTKVPYPVVGAAPSYGTSGQVLATNADGTTDWQDPVVPSDAQATQVITQWLNNHPEATTTVQDGAISTAKLADGAVTTTKLANGSVTDIKLAQSGVKSALRNTDVNAVFNVRYALYTNKKLGIADGKISDQNGLVSKITNLIPVEVGDVFRYNGFGAGSMASVCWYDAGGSFLGYAQYNNEIVKAEITVPSNPANIAYARFASFKYGSNVDSVILYLSRDTVANSFGTDKDIEELYAGRNIAYENKTLIDYITNQQLNVIPYAAYTDQKLITSTGVIGQNSGIVTKITEFIPCVPGMIFKYKGLGYGSIASVCYYDRNKRYISGDVYSSEITYTSITIPSNAYYVRFSSYKVGSNVDSIIFDIVRDYGTHLNSEEVVKPFTGIKWLVIGDSWVSPATLGANVKIFPDYVRDKLGCSLINKGVAGTGYWKTHSSGTAFYQRVPNFTEDADIVTIFGSFNDLGTEEGISGTSIFGTYTDTGTSTIAGCINTTLDAIEEKYPNAVICVLSPCPWSTTNNAENYANATNYVNLIKDICSHRSIPYLPLFNMSTLRPWDETFRSTYYQDGAHANTLGHKRFSGLIENFIREVYFLDK